MASPAVSPSISPEPGRAAPWPCAWHSEAFAAAMLFSSTLDRRSERCLLWRFESSNVVTVPTLGQKEAFELLSDNLAAMLLASGPQKTTDRSKKIALFAS